MGKHSIEEPIQEDITVHEEDDNLTPIATPLIQHQEQPGFEKMMKAHLMEMMKKTIITGPQSMPSRIL